MLFTPPLTPFTPAAPSQADQSVYLEPEELSLGPAMGYESFGTASVAMSDEEKAKLSAEAPKYAWRKDLTPEEKVARSRWLSGGRGRKGLRIVIVTGE